MTTKPIVIALNIVDRVVRIISWPRAERRCSAFGLSVTRAMRSHHFKILLEAGLNQVVDKENMAVAVLRREEIERGLPGLITFDSAYSSLSLRCVGTFGMELALTEPDYIAGLKGSL